MRVATTELLGAVNAERVIPDDPAATGKAEFLLKNELQFRGIFVADRQPERPCRLEDTMHRLAPCPRPVKVLLRVRTVIVDVVIISDVEGGISEDEVYRLQLQLVEAFDAI